MSAGKPNPLNKLSALFPNIVMPFSDNENIRDYIEKVVKELPKPNPYQVTDTLYSMKSIVDSQQLQIQRNMIESDEPHEQQVEHQEHDHFEPHKSPYAMKEETSKGQDIWWSQHEDSDNKDYLHFLN